MFLSAVSFAKSKSKNILVRMVSQAGTGFSFNTKRSRLREKLTLLHYDPFGEHYSNGLCFCPGLSPFQCVLLAHRKLFLSGYINRKKPRHLLESGSAMSDDKFPGEHVDCLEQGLATIFYSEGLNR
ncbi:PREDICTED: 39S ribosomal protein L33, mitochondrial isoform X1 [Myotis davidii]|uniref:39S ribosomal protein L33, mitochondrial isoform X1 n=1 Tax=Myotis davidii TaxID=225400 RepID=UPI0007672DA5|nr:PREDICTED: 39S ribosomal protein L33, mitochondrial isoform X1 [Myotis davidii]